MSTQYQTAACQNEHFSPDRPLRVQLKTQLGLPDSAFGEHEGDLYVLPLPGVGDCLRRNYPFWGNVRPFVGAAGSDWAGLHAYDIPFAAL